MKIYHYASPVGQFLIKPDPNGRWGLWFEDGVLGSYASAMAAADDVYMQSTGESDFDLLEGIEIPPDIHEWEVIDR